MVQLSGVGTRSDPKALYLAAVIFIVVTICLAIVDRFHDAPMPRFVKWYSLAEAPAIAKKLDRPILYVFTAAWCGPCKRMEGVAFNRPDIVDILNSKYVPVLVVDQEQEKGENTPAVKKLMKDYDVESFPRMVAVNPKYIGAKASDLFSTGNRIERSTSAVSDFSSWLDDPKYEDYADNWFIANRNHLPGVLGYRDPDSVRDYLQRAIRWHKSPPDKGSVKWQSLSAMKQKSEKPYLLVMVENFGSVSDRMRLRAFDDKDFCRLVEDHFTPILVEYQRDGANSADAVALQKRYGVERLPVMIFINRSGVPQIQDGFSSKKATMQFLSRCAGVSLPPEKDEKD